MLESLSQNFPSDASGCFVVRGSPNYTSSIAVYTLVVCFPVFAILRNVSAQHSSLFFYSNLFDAKSQCKFTRIYRTAMASQERARAGMPIFMTGLPNSRNFRYPGCLYLRGVQIFMTPVLSTRSGKSHLARPLYISAQY